MSGRDKVIDALAEARTVEPAIQSAKPKRTRRRKTEAETPPPHPSLSPDGGEGGRRPGERGGVPPADPPDSDDRDFDLECARLPLTDLGNARRFILRHGDEFLYVVEWGWLAWDGRRWSRQGADGMLMRAIHATVLAIAGEAKAFAESGEDTQVDVRKKIPVMLSDRIHAWCLESQGARHIACLPDLIRADIERAYTDFDREALAINCLNGTLRFHQVPDPDCPDPDETRFVWATRLDGHDRGDLITKLSGVAYDAEAGSPVYDRALFRLQPSPPVRRHIHDWGGASLTGVKLQRLAFWYGDGSNGKSTVLECFAGIAGDYAGMVPVETFVDQGARKSGSNASPDLARLPGKRLLRTTEMEKGMKLAEGLIKTATGGEPLLVRLLHRDFFDLFPVFKLTMFGNHKPVIRGMDHGIWRRVIFVSWPVKVPDSEVDPDLPQKLEKEWAGILNHLVAGVCRYLEQGLVLPEEVMASTAEFKAESDTLGRFLEDVGLKATERERRARLANGVLYPLYRAWSVAMDGSDWTMKGFSAAMKARGFRSMKTGGVMWWLDVEVAARKEDFISNPDVEDMSKWKPRKDELA